jgi:hypothetical protein
MKNFAKEFFFNWEINNLAENFFFDRNFILEFFFNGKDFFFDRSFR